MSDEKEDPRMDMGRNSEHYSDPTPGTAWENMRREEKRLDAARLVAQRYAADDFKACKLGRLAKNRHQGRNHNKAGGKEYR